MHLITLQKLRQALAAASISSSTSGRTIRTGLAAVDGLLPQQAFVSAAVHEVLSETEMPSFLLPILLARSASRFGQIVWCDPQRQFYPPAAAAMGLSLDRLLVVRPSNLAEQLWAVAECLRCKGIGACIAPLGNLSRLQARRLQLAAEQGGGIGVLLRPASAQSGPYAAATRWLVQPAPGEKTVQRWLLQLIHGHGGHLHQSVLVEVNRETHHVRALERVVYRPAQTKTASASA
jgi:protein ImuA